MSCVAHTGTVSFSQALMPMGKHWASGKLARGYSWTREAEEPSVQTGPKWLRTRTRTLTTQEKSFYRREMGARNQPARFCHRGSGPCGTFD